MNWICISREPIENTYGWQVVKFKPEETTMMGTMTLVVGENPAMNYMVGKSYFFALA